MGSTLMPSHHRNLAVAEFHGVPAGRPAAKDGVGQVEPSPTC
jgi:hypothetical protein